MMNDRLFNQLREERDEAQERVRQLEDALGINIPFPRSMNLTPTEAVFLGVILRRKYVSIEALHIALNKEDSTNNLIKVHICKLRRKLKKFNIHFKTDWGNGFQMEPMQKTLLRNLVNDLERQEEVA